MDSTSTPTPWEEQLDIDDSDLSLSSFLPPPPPKRQTLSPTHQTQTVKPPLSKFTLRSCSQLKHNPKPISQSQTLASHSTRDPSQSLVQSLSPFSLLDSSSTKLRLIPGPAAAVQAAMKRKASNDRDLLRNETGDAVITTQEYIRRAVENGNEDDGDFSEGPWLAALDFMRREGLMKGDDGVIGIPLCSIKSGASTDRVDQVVAIVKSFSPNSLGDTMVTLKDPTGVIGASIHHRVLNEKERGKEISVGAVLILRKVAIFFPTRCARYLNITLNNVIKVISKDHYPSWERKDLASASGTSFSMEKSGNLGMPEKASSQVRGRGRFYGIMNSFRQGTNRGKTIHETNELEGTTRFLDANFSSNGSIQRYNDSLQKEPLSKLQDTDVEFISTTEEETSQRTVQEAFGTDKCKPGNHEEGSPSRSIKWRTGFASVEVSDGKGGRCRNVVEEKRRELVSKSSILRWTDEQLDQLLDLD